MVLDGHQPANDSNGNFIFFQAILLPELSSLHLLSLLEAVQVQPQADNVKLFFRSYSKVMHQLLFLLVADGYNSIRLPGQVPLCIEIKICCESVEIGMEHMSMEGM